MQSPRKNPLGNFRRPEALEARDLLAGHGFAALSHFAAAAALQQASHVSAAVAGVRAAVQNGVFSALHEHGGESSGTRLTATLTDSTSGATATINYKSYLENGETETKLSVTITGAAADSKLDVSIGGTVVGQIVTDANGKGTLVLSSNPSGDEQALPDNFPTDIAAGAAVTVGDLSGTLATPTRSGGHGGCHGEGTRITAALTDANSSATGTAVYHTVTNNGTTTSKLKVRVTGAAASSSLDVAVDGTVVGQLTTNANGAGKATFANLTTTITTGSTITVGSMTGTFAATATQSSLSFSRHR